MFCSWNLRCITINKEKQKLPFEDASFDYIVCASLLSLLSRKEIIINLLREFHRVIKVQGKLFLDINGINSEFAIYAKKLPDLIKLHQQVAK